MKVDKVEQTEQIIEKPLLTEQHVIICQKCQNSDNWSASCPFKISRKRTITTGRTKQEGEVDILSSVEERSYATTFNRNITDEENERKGT